MLASEPCRLPACYKDLLQYTHADKQKVRPNRARPIEKVVGINLMSDDTLSRGAT